MPRLESLHARPPVATSASHADLQRIATSALRAAPKARPPQAAPPRPPRHHQPAGFVATAFAPPRPPHMHAPIGSGPGMRTGAPPPAPRPPSVPPPRPPPARSTSGYPGSHALGQARPMPSQSSVAAALRAQASARSGAGLGGPRPRPPTGGMVTAPAARLTGIQNASRSHAAEQAPRQAATGTPGPQHNGAQRMASADSHTAAAAPPGMAPLRRKVATASTWVRPDGACAGGAAAAAAKDATPTTAKPQGVRPSPPLCIMPQASLPLIRGVRTASKWASQHLPAVVRHKHPLTPASTPSKRPRHRQQQSGSAQSCRICAGPAAAQPVAKASTWLNPAFAAKQKQQADADAAAAVAGDQAGGPGSPAAAADVRGNSESEAAPIDVRPPATQPVARTVLVSQGSLSAYKLKCGPCVTAVLFLRSTVRCA